MAKSNDPFDLSSLPEEVTTLLSHRLRQLLEDGLSAKTVQDEEVDYWWQLYEQARTRTGGAAPWPGAADLTSHIGTEAVDSIHAYLGRTCVPLQLPLGAEKDFRGVIDLVSMTAEVFAGDESGKMTDSEIPAGELDAAKAARETLIEAVAETDEALMEKYFANGTLTQDELVAGLTGAVEVTTLPATLHQRPERIADAVVARIGERRGDDPARPVLVAYADCGTGGALDRALALGKGSCFLLHPGGEILSWFSSTRTDIQTGESFPELEPKHDERGSLGRRWPEAAWAPALA